MNSRFSTIIAGLVVGLVLNLTITQAAPFAKRIPFTQPDGTRIELWGVGDEFYAVFETLDGFTVVYNPPAGAYQYAVLSADGETLLPGGVTVGRNNLPASGFTPHLRAKLETVRKQIQERHRLWDQGTDTSVRWEALKEARRQAQWAGVGNGNAAAPAAMSSDDTPREVTGLCLLVDFDDDPRAIPATDIADFCNGDAYTGYGNNGSVKQYFLDNSKGKLNYHNIVTPYVRVPNPKSYYNDPAKDAGIQGNLLLKDAITAMKQLANYRTEILPVLAPLSLDIASNNVIACNVYFAGGNSGIWATGLWPHAWALRAAGAQLLDDSKPDGAKIWRYQMSDIGNTLELGTFCHENGHMVCGFPDLYDYQYDSKGGAGVFCLMGYGGYAYNPVQISAYLKIAAGWANVIELNNASSQTVALYSAGDFFNCFYRYQKTGVATEYFLLENRQRTGRDAYLPSAGIAVWHIDELGNRDNQNLLPNATNGNYQVTLVQADNLWHFEANANAGDVQDLFYSQNRARAYGNQFTDSSTPNAHWWDGTASRLQLRNFSAASATMTVQVGAPPPMVTLTSPRSGANYKAPANISLAASVATNGRLVDQVQFYAGDSFRGAVAAPPYNFTWVSVAAGKYAIKARVIYDGGMVDSAPVNITVR